MDYSTQLPCPSVSYGICSNLCPIQPSCPLSPPSLPALIFPNISVFSNESTLRIRWPKYWSFGFSISTYKKHSGLISFRIDWLNFLAVQGILKSLLQHHNSKASILQCSAFIGFAGILRASSFRIWNSTVIGNLKISYFISLHLQITFWSDLRVGKSLL